MIFRFSLKPVAPFLIFLAAVFSTFGQSASFEAPDTVCVGQSVNIINSSTPGQSFYWSFCSNTTLPDPLGVNIGNPGNLLKVPGYIELVQDGAVCYSFVANQGTNSVIRYNHGNSFRNNPLSWDDLGSFGLIGDTIAGISFNKDNGRWIAFVNNNNRIVRLDFGNSLANTPSATLFGPYSILFSAHGLHIMNEGGSWVGYITCSWGNKLVRITFGNSLMNAPVLTDLGAPGNLNKPTVFQFIRENGAWYALVADHGNDTHTRLSFGNSLFNNPTGVNLGTICPSITPNGIALIPGCGELTAFQLNYSGSSPNLIWRMNFPAGITGPATGISLGSIGSMSQPSHFSGLFRVGDTLFMYVTNRKDFTITRLRFLPCTDAAFPSSTLFNPPSCTYSQPGIYNIRLTVNEGLPNQSTACKQIVVIRKPAPAYIDTLLCFGTPYHAGGIWQTTPGTYYDTIAMAGKCDSIIQTTLAYKPEIVLDIGNDTTFCQGTMVVLHAGVKADSYKWQDGSPDSTYTVLSPGNYWLTIQKDGCLKSDTIRFGDCVTPLWFPNVFTPNGDGRNEWFHPVGTGVSKFNIVIFDRWGMEVFESNTVEPGWDGSVRGAQCSDGVYMYIATWEMEDSPGQTYHAHGSVTVLR